MARARIMYDEQAAVFESRAGIPDPAAAQVADAVRRLGRMGPDDLLVELGAGTGVIGQWLVRQPGRYLGLDSSRGMLDVFRPRLPADSTATLRYADADRPWPVDTGSARVIFGSRVLHLLDPEHVTREVKRVAHPGGAVLLCGRIKHSPDSARMLTRSKLRELLVAQGLQPRPTGGRPVSLLEQMAATAGAETLAPEEVARWPETMTVTEAIGWWHGKTSLGGVNPPAAVAEALLRAVDAWAVETFGEPAPAITTETRYLLEGVRLPPAVPDSGADRAESRPREE